MHSIRLITGPHARRSLILTTAAAIAVVGGISAQTTASADPAPHVPVGTTGAVAAAIPSDFRMNTMQLGQKDDPYGYLGYPVKQAQLLLRRWSPGLATDGSFGYGTKAAVEKFQRAERLPVTGKLTRADFYRLFVRQTVKYGSKGDAVRAAQTYLRRISTTVKVDGVFGPTTLKYVLQDQRGHGTACHNTGTDGIVGPYTWAMFFEGEGDTDPCLEQRATRR